MSDQDAPREGEPSPEGSTGGWSRRLLVRFAGYFAVMLVLMALSDKFGCRRGSSITDKSWNQVWNNLPELAGIAAFAAVVLTAMSLLRKRWQK